MMLTKIQMMQLQNLDLQAMFEGLGSTGDEDIAEAYDHCYAVSCLLSKAVKTERESHEKNM